MRAIILTSDKSLWALQPYVHLHRKYWPEQAVLVAGFTPPPFALPEGFEFVSLGQFADFPVHKWSDALIQLLAWLQDELILWTMDDFWLVRRVQHEAILSAERFMLARPDVARMDLSTDRLYAAGLHEVGPWETLDIIGNHLPVPYNLSFQAGIWRREKLLSYLVPGETPWQVEIEGSNRMNRALGLSYGTRQCPLRYLIAVQQGQLTLDGGYQQPAPIMTEEDKQAVLKWVPR